MALRSPFNPHITEDTSVLERPLSAFQQILAAQTRMPKPSPSPETLLQDIDWESCIDIRDFGAKTNGSSDDSDAIRKAIEFAKRLNPEQTGVICIPAGRTAIGSVVKVPSGIVFRGAGQMEDDPSAGASQGSVIVAVGSWAANTAMFAPEDTAAAGQEIIDEVGFFDLTIDGNSAAPRGIGPTQSFGTLATAVFNKLYLHNVTINGCTSVGLVGNSNGTVVSLLVAKNLRLKRNSVAGALLVYDQAVIENFEAEGNPVSLIVRAVQSGSHITGTSRDTLALTLQDGGVGVGLGTLQDSYVNITHTGTGISLNASFTASILRANLIHIDATAAARTTNPVVSFAQTGSSPNAIKGNFITVVGADDTGATAPVIAYGTQVGNNTFNVVHHLAAHSTAPKYTGVIGNNSVNYDLLETPLTVVTGAPIDAEYIVNSTNNPTLTADKSINFTTPDVFLNSHRWLYGFSGSQFVLENDTGVGLGPTLIIKQDTLGGSGVVNLMLATDTQPQIQFHLNKTIDGFLSNAILGFGPGGVATTTLHIHRRAAGQDLPGGLGFSAGALGTWFYSETFVVADFASGAGPSFRAFEIDAVNRIIKTQNSYLEMDEITAPTGDPAANKGWLYSKDVAGQTHPFWQQQDGTEFDLTSSGGSALTVQEGGVTVDATVSLINFGPGFDVTEPVEDQVTVALDLTEINPPATWFSSVDYVFAPDALPTAAVAAGAPQGPILITSDNTETGIEVLTSARVDGSGSITLIIEIGSTDDLDTATWSTLKSVTLATTVNGQIDAFTSSITASRLLRLNVSSVSGTWSGVTCILRAKRPLIT